MSNSTATSVQSTRRPLSRIAGLLRAAVSPVVDHRPHHYGLFETLEDRNLKSVTFDSGTDTVHVYGTSNNDIVQLDMYTRQVFEPGFGLGGISGGAFVTKTFIDVVDNGDVHTFLASSVSKIRAYLYSGNDWLDVKTPTGGFFNMLHNTIDFSKPINAYGYDGNDTLEGGNAADYFSGSSGHDRMYPRAGNDTVYGSSGNDYASLGDGNDYASMGDGNDTAYGSAGNDRLYGGSNNDYLSAGSGADYVSGQSGYDTMYGSTGNDTMHGGDHSDRIEGWTGHDYITGGDGNDSIYGSYDNDTVYAGNGNDYVDGYSGNDYIAGENGGDTLHGGGGQDSIWGGWGNDSITGSSGSDVLQGQQNNDTIDGGSNNDSIWGQSGNDLIRGGSGNDLLQGQDGEDSIYGNSGNDTLYGQNHDDDLYGGRDSDTLYGGDGNDGLYGGFGVDYLHGGAHGDRFLDRSWMGGFLNLFRQYEDTHADVNGNDTRIAFENAPQTTVSFNGQTPGATWTYAAGAFSEQEIELIDSALSVMHKATDNVRLLEKADGGQSIYRRVGALMSTTDPNNFVAAAWNGGGIQTYADGTFDGSDNSLRQTVFHEMGHNWDNEWNGAGWRALSGWVQSSGSPGWQWQASTGVGDNWWHLSSATFTRSYGRTNPLEDFATSFANNMMNRAGWAYSGNGTDVSLIPAKNNFINNMVNAM